MEETEQPGEPPTVDFRPVEGMDPAANWLLGFGVEDFLPDPATTPIPFLLDLGKDAVGPFLKVFARGGMDIVPFENSNGQIEEDDLVPLTATRKALLDLLDDSPESQEFRKAKKRIVLSSPLTAPGRAPEPSPDAKRPGRFDEQALHETALEAAPDGIVVAAIDDGFAFAHERFQNADGTTRIEAFWDMNKSYPFPKPADGELKKAQIEDLIKAAKGSGGGVDEDAVYQDARLLEFGDPRHKPLAWRASHGTHVLDLATGSDPATGGPPIIAVQLPSPVVARTTGELLDFYVWLGVRYVLDRARGRPVVINVSFGYDAGPHDGKGILEKHFSRLLRRRRAVVVLPAGNAQLSRCHATIYPRKNRPVVLDWIVQPEDRTHSVIEIWLPPARKPGGRIALTIVLPDGTEFPIAESAPGDPLPPQVPLDHAGRKMGLAEIWERQGDRRRMIRIAIAPTARAQPVDRGLAPAGRWKLSFEAGARPLRAPAHAWVQRDDSLYGYPQRGRQSYFDHERYERFDGYGYEMDVDPPAPAAPCPITRTSLLNAIATSPNVVVAGGYRTRDSRIARYSSGGPNTPIEEPPRRKPDALLPSDGSPAHPGMLAAGARSGARVAMDGSSVAAPQLARHVAGWLANPANPGRPAVKALAEASTIPRPEPTSPDRDGHGRLPRLELLEPLKPLDPLRIERFES